MAKSTKVVTKTTPPTTETPVRRRGNRRGTMDTRTDNPGADTEEKRAQKEKEIENAGIKATQETQANQEVPADGQGVE